ncbi:hypothetical protein Pan216_46040 [Planctomycetes bacterium Pan216]|uniref:Uncharacterized protein n=1 Tax=Kolteria novifilia TaxID=2527975 RepID=A0A518B9Y3_9BACT|nr:hypothetical protein Pan216_46040 [Planctomycetes bacterium Pan216]
MMTARMRRSIGWGTVMVAIAVVCLAWRQGATAQPPAPEAKPSQDPAIFRFSVRATPGSPDRVYLRVEELHCLESQDLGADEIFYRAFGMRTPAQSTIEVEDEGPNATKRGQRLWYTVLEPGERAATTLELWEYDPSLTGAGNDLIGTVDAELYHVGSRIEITMRPGQFCELDSAEDAEKPAYRMTGSDAIYRLVLWGEAQEAAEIRDSVERFSPRRKRRREKIAEQPPRKQSQSRNMRPRPY